MELSRDHPQLRPEFGRCAEPRDVPPAIGAPCMRRSPAALNRIDWIDLDPPEAVNSREKLASREQNVSALSSGRSRRPKMSLLFLFAP